MLQQTWHAQFGTLCRGVSWERHGLEELQLVARCIGGPGLAAVCRLLAQDHAGWSGERACAACRQKEEGHMAWGGLARAGGGLLECRQ